RGRKGLEGGSEEDAERHRREDPDREVAIEEGQPACRRCCVRHRNSCGCQASLLPAASVTCSPSSLAKAPFWAGRRSRTVSDGRQSFTPFGETTIGRLIRTGCFSIASSSCSS